METLHRQIPNLSHPNAPIGVDDKSNLGLFRGKTPLPTFSFKPLDHVELAEKLDLVDFEGGASVAGHGFYFLKNEAVLLELALFRDCRVERSVPSRAILAAALLHIAFVGSPLAGSSRRPQAQSRI